MNTDEKIEQLVSLRKKIGEQADIIFNALSAIMYLVREREDLKKTMAPAYQDEGEDSQVQILANRTKHTNLRSGFVFALFYFIFCEANKIKSEKK